MFNGKAHHLKIDNKIWKYLNNLLRYFHSNVKICRISSNLRKLEVVNFFFIFIEFFYNFVDLVELILNIYILLSFIKHFLR